MAQPTNVSTSAVTTDPAQLTEAQINLANNTAVILNSISMAFCLIVITVYFYMRRNNKAAMNRISLRLTVTAVIASFLFSVFQILVTLPSGPSAMCSVSMWGYVFFDLLSSWIVTMIALNLHIVFVKGRSVLPTFEKWYFLWSLFLSSVAFLPLLFDGYGWEETLLSCWEFGTYYGWSLVTSSYCALTIVIVLRKIKKNARELAKHAVTPWVPGSGRQNTSKMMDDEDTNLNTSPQKSAEISQATRIVRRVIWYPIVIICCNIINLISDVYLSVTACNVTTYYSFYIGVSSQGLILCIVFFFDPAVGDMANRTKAELIQRYYDRDYPQFGRSMNRHLDGRSLAPISQKGTNSRPHYRRDGSCTSSARNTEEEQPPTRWNRIVRQLVYIFLVDKEAKKAIMLRKSAAASKTMEMAEEGGINAHDKFTQSNGFDNTSEFSTMDNDELSSPTFSSHRLELKSPAASTAFELLPIQKPAATAGNPKWSLTTNPKESKEPMEIQVHNTTPGNLDNDPVPQRRESVSSSATDNSDTLGLEPVTRVSSFLRQPARRQTPSSPTNPPDGMVAGLPTSPNAIMLGEW
ncbi:hypothetical protein BC938DRAFT_476425 [Jimgerdemannia flammicorona]|uniref:G-protein coupled receptors family 2 profile 2 domain-containing protein n=1 Tax=Jimgerdemannia flammicorona TaxID=994334 RepID=A0A433PHF7_9FUNG|nr:hypothetical protein BC938DRAFT_476425 [Jimgerdemannia flammicorona]